MYVYLPSIIIRKFKDIWIGPWHKNRFPYMEVYMLYRKMIIRQDSKEHYSMLEIKIILFFQPGFLVFEKIESKIILDTFYSLYPSNELFLDICVHLYLQPMSLKCKNEYQLVKYFY